MNWSEYSSLKSDGNVSFSKEIKGEREYVVFVQKSWNSYTGEANADSKREYSLSDLENEKARYDAEMARAKAQSDELKKAIADFKKV
jgi:phage terminase Nu1 subunit (DNA packaging protein)|tara:strand:- start:442 stop:702 length:261 start_codon:yes stop_codon:yes gene_type:complete